MQIECEHAALNYLNQCGHLPIHQYADEKQMPRYLREGFLQKLQLIGQDPADLKSWQQNAAKIAKKQGSARRMSAQLYAEDLYLPPRQAWQLIGEGLYSPLIWLLLDQLLMMELYD